MKPMTLEQIERLAEKTAFVLLLVTRTRGQLENLPPDGFAGILASLKASFMTGVCFAYKAGKESNIDAISAHPSFQWAEDNFGRVFGPEDRFSE